MAKRDILYLTIDTFLDIVVKSNLPLPSVGWYLFRVVSGIIRLVIILLLYLVMIYLGKTRMFMLSCTFQESDQDFFKSKEPSNI